MRDQYGTEQPTKVKLVGDLYDGIVIMLIVISFELLGVIAELTRIAEKMR